MNRRLLAGGLMVLMNWRLFPRCGRCGCFVCYWTFFPSSVWNFCSAIILNNVRKSLFVLPLNVVMTQRIFAEINGWWQCVWRIWAAKWKNRRFAICLCLIGMAVTAEAVDPIIFQLGSCVVLNALLLSCDDRRWRNITITTFVHLTCAGGPCECLLVLATITVLMARFPLAF